MDKFAFILDDMSVLKNKSKIKTFFQDFKILLTDFHKLEVVSVLEILLNRKTMQLNLQKIRLKTGFFEDNEEDENDGKFNVCNIQILGD